MEQQRRKSDRQSPVGNKKKKRRPPQKKTGKSSKKKGRAPVRRKKLTWKQRLHRLKQPSFWKKTGKNFLRGLRQKETLWLLLLLAAVLCFFLRFTAHQVDGQSMEPTFQNGDRILIVKTKEITRYSIVAFDPKYTEDDSYVKRVIGLPGDKIQVRGLSLYLLPKENEQDEVEDSEELSDGTIKVTLSQQAANELLHLDRIPADQYFVQGDNRLHSSDSREFGLIESNQIEGIVVYRYYPLNTMGLVH